MTIVDQDPVAAVLPINLAELCAARWPGQVSASLDSAGRICRLACRAEELREICAWLMSELGFAFATLIVEEHPAWLLTYIFTRAPSRLGFMSSCNSTATPWWCPRSVISRTDLRLIGMNARPKTYSA